MKKIRFFIGSSIEELANERNELARFIQGLNNKYVDRGLFFEAYFCEETSAAMQEGGSQKRHDDYIEHDADAAVFLFFTRAGQYTLGELDLARRTFLSGRRPAVFVFFKAVDSVTAATEEIKKCVEKVGGEYGHYFKLFDSIDTVKLELLQFLVDSTGGLELKVENGKVFINEELVENIDAGNVFAYQNNPNLQKLKAQIAALLSRMTAASAKGDAAEMLRISAELGEVQKTYHALEKDILGMLKKFADENKKGARANPRRMEALRLLELGKTEAAKALISQEELDQRAESLQARKDLADRSFADEADEITEDAVIRIQALRQDIGNANRFAGIEAVYDSIYQAAQTAKRYDVLYDYASYLYDQKNYPKGIRVAERLKYLFDDPDEEVSEKDKAKLFNLLGVLYSDNKDLKKAGPVYESALEIRRRLAESVSRSAYEPDVAMTCNNLAILYADNGRPGDAKKLYLEVLEIYRRLAETVSRSAYEPDVAKTCNNLAILYKNNGRPGDAEELYQDALEILRRLAENVSRAAYEPDVAMTCNNLAGLYMKNGRPDDAEELCLEALEILRRLAENVSRAAYEPAVAMTCFNLALLYLKNNSRDKAKELFAEAKEIAAKYKDVNPFCRQIFDRLKDD